MTCVAENIPCKYYAASGCGFAASGRPCWENVGAKGDWVLKVRNPDDGKEYEDAWLQQRLPDAKAAPAKAPASGGYQSKGDNDELADWRGRMEAYANTGDAQGLTLLSDEIQSALACSGKLTGANREAAKKLQKKAAKASQMSAEQLGATRAEGAARAEDAARAAEAKKQVYTWAVVVDLEGKPPHVCELPAIVLETETGREVGRFHRWIKSDLVLGPKAKNPGSNAVTFPRAISDFQDFLFSRGVDVDYAVLICCGDFDANALHQMLRNHQIPTPEFLCRWTNLKDAVLNMEFSRNPSVDMKEIAAKLDGMNRLADYLDMPGVCADVEHHHLGMFDTMKIATILQHLIRVKELVVRETAIRNPNTGEVKFWSEPRIKNFRDRA